jgi:tRNA dimethylallyltransferase
MNKTCIIIAGPTASGKTSIAINLAQHYSTQIISADSRQCYQELNIGVAKPSAKELTLAQHYFINTHSITEEVNAAVFEKYALEVAEKIFEKNDVAIMTGGTGLYIKAFCEGLDNIPQVPADVKLWVNEGFNSGGIPWLQQQLQKADPQFFAAGEMQNPRRMMRALEVVKSSGLSILHFQTKQKITRPFKIVKIGLDWPRPMLYQRINERVDQMITDGLVEEARGLFSQKHMKALHTVGYQELFAHFEGQLSLEQAVALIKQNTRHYAKRQMTWFNKDTNMQWVNAEVNETLFNQVLSTISRA